MNTNSILSQLFEISDSTSSYAFLSIILIIIIFLFIAMFSKNMKTALVKLHILEKNESPKSFLVWIISVMVIVRVVQVFILQPFLVDGSSMYPTFKTNDLLLINKFGYKLNEPERGDVIVFKFIKENNSYSGKYFLKRLIALPREKVTIHDTGTTVTSADGKKHTLDETYVKYPKLLQDVEYTLGDDEYFVMGDNRDGSYDSRAWGPIHMDQISGKAIFRIHPNIGLYPGETNYKD